MYEKIARFGKALSAPKRLELVDLLSQSPRTVEGARGHEADRRQRPCCGA